MDTLRRSLAQNPPRRILIVRLSALGDVLHCLPALDALRALFPEATIDWVAESLGAQLIVGHPALERVITIPRKEVARDLWQSDGRGAAAVDRGQNALAELRREEYDLAIDFQGNLRSTLITRAARAKVRVGHHPRETKEFRRLLAGVRPDTPAGAVHRVEKNLHLIRALGFRGETPAGQVPLDPEVIERFTDELPADGAPTIFHPFVSAFGRFKEWPLERFAALAKELDARGHRVWVTAAPEDFARRDELLELAEGSASESPTTRSTRELAALLSLARGVVAADTGPLHLAAFAGVPVVGLFGPKDPRTYGPWSARGTVVRAGVPCSPCRLRKCDHAICMSSISVGSVLAAIEEIFPAAPQGVA